jgi:hypothetical protein
MTRLSRRALLSGTAVALGAAALSVVVVLGGDDGPATRVRERLGAGSIGPALRRLGVAVNEVSPGSAARADAVLRRAAEADPAVALAAASRSDAPHSPVLVSGWVLPDVLAGVAGAAAAEPG